MKYLSSHYLIAGFLLCFQASQAMEQSQSTINKYQGWVIDQNSITTLAPVMTKSLQQVVDNWTNKHKDLLHTLVPETSHVPVSNETIKKAIDQNKQLLTSRGFTNLSKNNYIVELPAVGNKRYFIQAGGPINKAINIVHGNGYHWDDIQKKIADGDLTTMDTYQTVSRVIGYLRAQEIIEQQKITTFKVPKTYLAQIPGRNNLVECGACDANSIIVQKDIGDNYVQIRSNPSLLVDVNPETLKDLLVLIKHVPLWDINSNGLINKETYTFGQSDLEQPNNENPKNFFNKNASKHQWNVAEGIAGIIKLYQKASETCDVKEGCKTLKTLIEQDQDLQQSPHLVHIQNQVAILDVIIKQ